MQKCENVEFGAVQKCANLVELEKCCKMSIHLQKIDLDTAENEPTEVSQKVIPKELGVPLNGSLRRRF